MANRLYKKFKDKYSYYKTKLRYKTLYPSGHYYSPIPARADIEARKDVLFDRNKRDIPGIDLNEKEQLRLLEDVSPYYAELPFPEAQTEDMRYCYDNIFYGHSDVICLYSIIRHFKPSRIIEVGSGFSSAAVLDINDRFFDSQIGCAFIEPYPTRLQTLLNDKDQRQHRIIQSMVQDVDLNEFCQLQENDILFIDSSHVGKTGSDLNFILFEILPVLKPGVILHFHDVFFPFEYPEEWIRIGRAWNECYYLRAFLQYNTAYKIVLFNTYMQQFHREWFEKNMPLCLCEKIVNGSIWLQKVR